MKAGKKHTSVESWGELQGVDELGVKTRCHLDTHAADKEVEVQNSKVGLLVPGHLVLRDHTREDRVGRAISC
jgi:hypothetical protein